MIDQDSKHYANSVATDETWQIVYQSFRDGYTKGEHDKSKSGIWLGIGIGIFAGILLCLVALVIIDRYFRPILA